MRRAAPLVAAFALSSNVAWAEPLEVIAQAIVGGRAANGDLASATAIIGTCDATLVAPTLLVTAAHCLEDGPTQAQFGASSDDATLTVPIAQCGAHPDYQPGVTADLAFCVLAQAVDNIQPAQVPADCADTLGVGDALWLVGHGYSSAAEQDARIARQVEVRIDADHDLEFVVGDDTHGACNGDSGGSVYSADGVQLVAVISRRGPADDGGSADNCASRTVVTALAPYLDWLQQASGVALGIACDPDDAIWSSDDADRCAGGDASCELTDCNDDVWGCADPAATSEADCSDAWGDTSTCHVPAAQQSTFHAPAVHGSGCSLGGHTADLHVAFALPFMFLIRRRAASIPSCARPRSKVVQQTRDGRS